MEIVDELTKLIMKWKDNPDFKDLDFIKEIIELRNRLSQKNKQKKVGK